MQLLWVTQPAMANGCMQVKHNQIIWNYPRAWFASSQQGWQCLHGDHVPVGFVHWWVMHSHHSHAIKANKANTNQHTCKPHSKVTWNYKCIHARVLSMLISAPSVLWWMFWIGHLYLTCVCLGEGQTTNDVTSCHFSPFLGVMSTCSQLPHLFHFIYI